MVAQGGRRQIHVVLNVPGGGALRPCLNDEAQDFQADRMPQGIQLLCVALQARRHVLLLIFSKHARKGYF
jgi:hypothetical protein